MTIATAAAAVVAIFELYISLILLLIRDVAFVIQIEINYAILMGHHKFSSHRNIKFLRSINNSPFPLFRAYRREIFFSGELWHFVM
jgi:hypothetical protein